MLLLACAASFNAYAQQITNSTEKESILTNARKVATNEAKILDDEMSATIRSARIAFLYDSLWHAQRKPGKTPAAPTFTLVLDNVREPSCTINTYQHFGDGAIQKRFDAEVEDVAAQMKYAFPLPYAMLDMFIPPNDVDVKIARDTAGYNADFMLTGATLHMHLGNDFTISDGHAIEENSSEETSVTLSHISTSAGLAVNGITFIFNYNRGAANVHGSVRMEMKVGVINGRPIPVVIDTHIDNLLGAIDPAKSGLRLDDTLSIINCAFTAKE
jgi:hypothetical protein